MALQKRGDTRNNDIMSTILGVDATLEGNLNVDGSVRVDGKLHGNLVSSGTVTIGKQGRLEGNIKADTVIVGGKVKGNISAKTKLVLEQTSTIDGDIAAKQLEVAEGAGLNGHCGMSGQAVDTLSKQIESELNGSKIQGKPQGATLPILEEEPTPVPTGSN